MSQKEENLDDLLNDALNDFNISDNQSSKGSDDHALKTDPSSVNAWSNEFIESAKENFESTFKSLVNKQKGEFCEAEIDAISSDISRLVEAAADSASDTNGFASVIEETMKKMNENGSSVDDFSEESLSQLLGSLKMDGLDGDSVDGAGDIGGLFPLMQTMMENILSKEVLYPPLKDIVERFPEWLAENRDRVGQEEFERYNKQYDVMNQIVKHFEAQGDSSSASSESKTSDNVLDLMQKLQDLGQPPKDLMQGFDSSDQESANGISQIGDFSSLLKNAGFPSYDSTKPDAGSGTQNPEQCCVM